jgi:hypothetical protein
MGYSVDRLAEPEAPPYSRSHAIELKEFYGCGDFLSDISSKLSICLN